MPGPHGGPGPRPPYGPNAVRVVGCGGGTASITRWVDANTREHSRMHTDTSSHSDIDIRIHEGDQPTGVRRHSPIATYLALAARAVPYPRLSVQLLLTILREQETLVRKNSSA